MKKLRDILKEINDNADPADVRREYIRLHNKKNRDEMEQRKYEILKDHPDVKRQLSK